jgi:hypothetical protein
MQEGWSLLFCCKDLRQAKVNVLWELQSPPFHYGDASRSASGDASQVAPALWADVVAFCSGKAFKGEISWIQKS